MRSLAIVAFLLPLCGCSEPTDPGDSPSGGSTGGAGTGTSGGIAAECQHYLSNLEGAHQIEIRVDNRSQESIWVDIAETQIEDEQGAAVEWLAGGCGPSVCEDLMSAPLCEPGGCDPSGPPPHQPVDPSDALSQQWDGAAKTPLEMTAECGPGSGCQMECWREDALAPGQYTARLTVFRCLTTEEDCWGGIELGDPLELAATFTAEDTEVVFVIDSA